MHFVFSSVLEQRLKQYDGPNPPVFQYSYVGLQKNLNQSHLNHLCHFMNSENEILLLSLRNDDFLLQI